MPMLAFMKKEILETARTGKLVILVLLFALFGVMNPAIAKLTPWMMKMLSDSLAENGLIVVNVQADAMTSWGQFYKNIPIALIFSDSFTKEYRSGTLLLTYVLRVIPKAKAYSPALLMNVNSLLSGMEGTKVYGEAVLAAAVSTVIFVALSVLNMNKRQV